MLIICLFPPLLQAALEPLYALFASHSSLSAHEFIQLVVPMYDTQVVDLFKRLFEWSAVDAHDIDDDKYQFSKKFSEVRLPSIGRCPSC